MNKWLNSKFKKTKVIAKWLSLSENINTLKYFHRMVFYDGINKENRWLISIVHKRRKLKFNRIWCKNLVKKWINLQRRKWWINFKKRLKIEHLKNVKAQSTSEKLSEVKNNKLDLKDDAH